MGPREPGLAWQASATNRSSDGKQTCGQQLDASRLWYGQVRNGEREFIVILFRQTQHKGRRGRAEHGRGLEAAIELRAKQVEIDNWEWRRRRNREIQSPARGQVREFKVCGEGNDPFGDHDVVEGETCSVRAGVWSGIGWQREGEGVATSGQGESQRVGFGG